MQVSYSKLTLFCVSLLGLSSLAQARPPFARKEGVRCDYCHSGQQPRRNYRGVFYGANNHTFNGFDDQAEAEKAGATVGPDSSSRPASLVPPKKPEPAPTPEPTPTPAPETLSELDTLKAKAAEWYSKYKKNPKSNAKGFSQALSALGHAQMLDETTEAPGRYAVALKTLRSALKADAGNKPARADVAKIATIYKKMGKPLPK